MNQYKKTALVNGLTVITGENKFSPIVTLGIVVKAGSKYEKGEESGYAHILEHMLMKGTSRRPTSYEIGVELDKIGASSNATTGKESVLFVSQAAGRHAERLFDIASDRIMNSLINPATLENEKKIIIEELRRAEENHDRRASVLATSYLLEGSQISKDTLGNEKTISSATREKLINYCNKFYPAGNSALIALGNLSHEESMGLAEKYFGSWQKGKTVKMERDVLAPINPHFRFEKLDTQRTYIRLFYRISGAELIKESLIFEMLSNYLSYGYSSILKHELRTKKGLIYGIGASIDTFSDVGIFKISTATASPGLVADIIIKTMGKLQENITNETLETLKEQTISIMSRRMANPFNEMGFLINGFVLYDKLITLDDLSKILRDIKLGDVKSSIKKHLTPENSLLILMGPKEIKVEY